MVLCDVNKFIFLRTGKTASSTTSRMLIPIVTDGFYVHSETKYWVIGGQDGGTSTSPVSQHINAIDAARVMPWRFEHYLTISWIRNPWDRFVSWYYWQRSNRELDDGPSFEWWLKEITARTRAGSKQWRQDVFTRGVDFVGRFESLADDLDRLFKLIGKPMPPLLHLKPGYRRSGYRHMYSQRMRYLVRDNFDCFDYGF